MLSNVLFYFIAVLAGLAVAIQAGVNNELQMAIKSPLVAALASFIIGSLCILFMIFIFDIENFKNISNISGISWWKLTGGALGAFYICSLIFVIPKIGAANMIAFAVASQLIFSVILDHYGWVGFPQNSISSQKIMGVALLILGLYFIKK